ncbi:MAG: hypothetical protein QM757_08230 [Paludibaculum sp.]
MSTPSGELQPRSRPAYLFKPHLIPDGLAGLFPNSDATLRAARRAAGKRGSSTRNLTGQGA